MVGVAFALGSTHTADSGASSTIGIGALLHGLNALVARVRTLFAEADTVFHTCVVPTSICTGSTCRTALFAGGYTFAKNVGNHLFSPDHGRIEKLAHVTLPLGVSFLPILFLFDAESRRCGRGQQCGKYQKWNLREELARFCRNAIGGLDIQN